VAARRGLKVVVVDRTGVGGQISTAERIENFPGFPQGMAGHELGPLLHEQAEAAGAEFVLDTVEALEIEDEAQLVRGVADVLQTRAVIIAAGSTQRCLGVPGEEKFLGRGVSHCASCDAPLFAGARVAVIGGGDSAADEALVLAEHAADVMLFHRGPRLRAQQALIDKVKATRNIAVTCDTVVEEILGEELVSGLRLRGPQSGTPRVEPTRGVFIYVGLEPNTAFLRGLLALDGAGHIETDVMMRTSVPGVFAAGDVRRSSVALLAAAAGDGATAAMSAWQYVRQS
jgi:thioredoxin reductase (NADPH)